ncbi:MAG: gliding motility-associated C-terminal domain-containing protein, partial [Bacteroidetes bacterium]|nr:gliding motility-associated C-terminal domain-containing protein [Bacteroidota bacterium]
MLAATDSSKCNISDTTYLTITVKKMEINISPAANICLGDSITLNASGGSAYLWEPSGSLNNSLIANPLAKPTATTTFTVSITENPCVKTASVNITVEDCSLKIPNVFTPPGNGSEADGVNDEFEIVYDGNQPYHIVIYNRWGRKMFEANQKHINWDGKAPDGLWASEGVYFYVLDIGKKSYHGSVTLLR